MTPPSKDTTPETNSLRLPLEIIEAISDAVVVTDHHDNIIAQNSASDNLPEAMLESIVSGIGTADFSDEFGHIQNIIFDEGKIWVIPLFNAQTSANLVLLDHFLKGIRKDLPPHRALGLAIRKSLGWQWVAVCRFLNDRQFEIMTWVDGDSAEGPLLEELEGTACELILKHETFMFFKDITQAFKDDEYQQLGAEVYAGLAYRVNNKPVGHIFALHNKADVDVGLADSVLTFATELFSGHLKMLEASEEVNTWRDAASRDSLTGLFNRRALDDFLSQQESTEHLCVVVIDLDGMKQINDTLGHQAGDKLLQDFGQGFRAISRESDLVFRFGGDEFVAAFEDSRNNIVSSFKKRLKLLILKMQIDGTRNIDASIGVARVSETSGDLRQCLALADKRMYEHKRKKKNR